MLKFEDKYILHLPSCRQFAWKSVKLMVQDVIRTPVIAWSIKAVLDLKIRCFATNNQVAVIPTIIQVQPAEIV